MRFLRKNTAVIVTVGPFYDKTDGVTIETALTITNERITLAADTDDGNAPTNILDNVTGATSGTDNDLNYISGNDAGMMQLELSAANTNRNGRLLLSITDAANHVPVFHEFMILDAAVYDSLVLGTDKLAVDAVEISGDSAAADNLETAADGGSYNLGGGGVVAASVTGAVGSVTGAVGSVTGNVGGNVSGSVGSVASGGITAASIADNAIDAGALATDAITEIQNGLATAAALDTIDNFLDTEIAAILEDTGTTIPAQISALNNLSAAQVNAEVDTALADINLDHLVKSAVDTNFATTVHLDSVIGHLADAGTSATFDRATDALEALAGASAPSAAAIADAVWDETLADHLTAGSTGAGLNAAGSAGDPWSTALPGAYGAGSAGKIVGDNLNATVSSRSTLDAAGVRTAVGLASANLDTQLAAIDDAVDSEVAAIITTLGTPAGASVSADLADIEGKVDDLETRLTATRAGYLDNLSGGAVATQASVNTIDDLLDTEVAAILEDTGTTIPAQIAALNNLSAAQVNAEMVDALAVDVIADSVAADGSRPTIAQAALMILRFLTEKAVSGTTLTVKKEDGSTAVMTFTLDDDTSPTSITRAS